MLTIGDWRGGCCTGERYNINSMPISDLPYRIAALAREGQYAYIARVVPRVMPVKPQQPAVDKVETKKSRVSPAMALVKPTKLRVMRNVTLCDGPSLWASIRAKRSSKSLAAVDAPGTDAEPIDYEPYAFFVSLRLFATRSMVDEYLASPEVTSHTTTTGSAEVSLKDDEIIIVEEQFLDPTSVELAKQEYTMMLLARQTTVSLDSLEEMMRRAQGEEDCMIPTSTGTKRSGPRKKKSATSTPAASRAAATAEPSTPVVIPTVQTVSEVRVVTPDSDDDEECDLIHPNATVVSDRPSGVDDGVIPKIRKVSKKRTPPTLREQYIQITQTPSRVIDVSRYDDTMRHHNGQIIDRVRHITRLSKCTVLPDLFPIVSDNIPAFERAMNALGGRFPSRIAEFKIRHQELRATRAAVQ